MPTVWEAEWTLGPVQMGAENVTHTGIQSSDYPVCSINNLLNIGGDVTSIQRSL